MEELHIKCPSCGIILEVRNSKNEAVKRITCPYCKRRLAVTFHDDPQPAQFVEIKMVQLADGTTKTIIRALTEEHVVKVNGEQLQKDDEVVLSVGDELQIDGKTSIFGKEGADNSQQPTSSTAPDSATSEPMEKSSDTLPSNPLPSEPVLSYGKKYAIIVALAILAFLGWKLFFQQSEVADEEVEDMDTIALVQPVQPIPDAEKRPAPRPKQKVREKEKAEQPASHQEASPNLARLSNYELERLAGNGNVDAQCQLGKRWVSLRDSINVVKGIQYLKLAARNGSSEAKSALRVVFTGLQRSAANGSTTAENILREQR